MWKITRKTNEWLQHVHTVDGPRRSYAHVKYEPAGKRKPRRLLEGSWKHYYYICFVVFMIIWKSYASQVGKRYDYVNNACDASRQNLTGLSRNWRNGYDKLCAPISHNQLSDGSAMFYNSLIGQVTKRRAYRIVLARTEERYTGKFSGSHPVFVRRSKGTF